MKNLAHSASFHSLEKSAPSKSGIKHLTDEISNAVGASGAALLQSDVRTVDIPVTPGVADYFKSYFLDKLHVSDVRAIRGVPLLLAGVPVVTDADLFQSEQDMMRDPLYGSLDDYGLRWFAAVGFRSGSALWGLSLQRTRHQGAFDRTETAALAQLAPRLTEVATLAEAVGHQIFRESVNALELVNLPVIALDRWGRAIATNAAAAAMLGDDIRIENRRLRIRDEKAETALADLADRLRNSRDMDVLPTAPIVVRRRDKHSILIRVLAIDAVVRNPFLGARAILLLTDLAQRPQPDPAILAAALGITPSEARLASLLAGGHSLDVAAVQLGISTETVRNHLKSIFMKTRTHRQGELIALMSRL